VQAATARHVECASARAIDLMHEVDQPDGIVFCWLQKHRARAIAKDYAGRAIGVIDYRRHHIRANHKNSLVSASCNELRSGLQRVNECRACSREIESPSALCSQLVLHHTCG